MQLPDWAILMLGCWLLAMSHIAALLVGFQVCDRLWRNKPPAALPPAMRLADPGTVQPRRKAPPAMTDAPHDRPAFSM